MRKGPIKPGEVFGRLTAIRRDKVVGAVTFILCSCTCGKQVSVHHWNLRSGNTRSCGCLAKESHVKHGDHKKKLYGVRFAMISRCHNPRNSQYIHYGHRGISVCDAWRADYLIFKIWALDHGYMEGLEIDRIDNNLGYYPENCRFTDRSTNVNNVRLLRRSNTSGFRGASFRKDRGTFVAQVSNIKSQRLVRSGFPTAESAARYRDAYCIIHNIVTPMNFPEMTLTEAKKLIERGPQ